MRARQKKPGQAGAAGGDANAAGGVDRVAAARHKRAAQRKKGEQQPGEAPKDDQAAPGGDTTNAAPANATDTPAPAADTTAPAANGKTDDQKNSEGIAPGWNGFLINDHTAGKDPIPAGTPVTVVEVHGEQLLVQTQSTGEQFQAPGSEFHWEPRVALDDTTGKARDDVYEEYEGALWGPDGPKESDVYQGNIGDCYVMSAMAAVCQQDPSAIMKLFSPTEPNQQQYMVTLYLSQPDGTMKATPVYVDTELPSMKDAEQKGDKVPAYAGNPLGAESGPDKPAKGPQAALWPALIEKAYAEAMGGYDAEGMGGFPVTPLSMLTGQKAENGPSSDEGILAQLQQYEKDGRAVCLSTRGDIQNTQSSAFQKGGDGAYTATLQANDVSCILDPGTVVINDGDSKNKSQITDDGQGKLVGENLDSGTVDYSTGAVSLKFKDGLGPDKPENLKATYDYQGLLSKELNLFGPHAYTFERLDGNNIILRNPWGSSDPVPIPAARFSEFFQDVSSVPMAKQGEGAQPPPQKTPPK